MSLSLLLTTAEQYPILSGRQERELCRSVMEGDGDAREALVLHNLRFLVSIAQRYRRYGEVLEDAVQEGSIGLIRAVESYDADAFQTRFSTYAAYWVRQSIRRYLTRQGHAVKLSTRTRLLYSKWLAGGQSFDDFTEKERRRILSHQMALAIISNNAATFNVETSPDRDDPHTVMANRELIEKAFVFMQDMNDRDKAVIGHTFGLFGYAKLSLREAGTALNLSYEGVRKIEARVLKSFQTIGGIRDEDD